VELTAAEYEVAIAELEVARQLVIHMKEVLASRLPKAEAHTMERVAR
jgi:hypothetical protein